MVIVYNPPTGATISVDFIGAGTSLAKPFTPNTKQYCEDEFAKALVETYPFLSIVTAEEAEGLKKLSKEEIKKEEVKEEVLQDDVPIAEVKKTTKKEEDKATEIPDDLKGTDWYGDGVKESRDGK